MNAPSLRAVRIAGTLVLLVALLLFSRTVDWADTWRVVAGSSWRLLLLAAVVNLVSLLLKALRWWVLMQPVGVSSLWLTIRATFAGAALNNMLVANGGEAARVIFVSRAAGVPSARVLATLALERLFEFTGYVVMLALAISLLPLPHVISRARPLAWLTLAAITALLVYLVRRPEELTQDAVPAPSWRHSARQFLHRFIHATLRISTAPRVALVLGITALVWILQVATYALTASAANFPIPLVGTVAAILAVNLGFAVRATPGNVGVFQMMYAIAAATFGLDHDQAIAVGLLIQTQQILPVTLLGALAAPQLLLHPRAAVREEREVVGAELSAPTALPSSESPVRWGHVQPSHGRVAEGNCTPPLSRNRTCDSRHIRLLPPSHRFHTVRP